MTLTPSFDLRDKDGFRPSGRPPVMLGLEGIRFVCQLSTEAAMEEIIAARFLWAFNLARAGADKIYLRVWIRSAICWKDTKLSQPEDFSLMFDQLFHPQFKHFKAVEVRNVLNFSSTDHVHNLLEDQLLDLAPGQTLNPRQSPLITRASIARFLKGRQLP